MNGTDEEQWPFIEQCKLVSKKLTGLLLDLKTGPPQVPGQTWEVPGD